MNRLLKAMAFVAVSSLSVNTFGFNITGTDFEEVALKHGLDPVLLYSVALAESASGRGDDNISPWPWTLRTLEGPFYALTQEQASIRLQELIKEKGPDASIDIGFMQVNLFWHGHRVKDPAELLDPRTNLDTGAGILSETIRSAPNDLELGIGRYHHWKDESRTRFYGRRVLSIYQQLKNLSPEGRYAAHFNN
jgi:hypothetical protein